jgi:hypothetical protein
MMNYAELASVLSGHPAPLTDQLRLVVGIFGS